MGAREMGYKAIGKIPLEMKIMVIDLKIPFKSTLMNS